MFNLSVVCQWLQIYTQDASRYLSSGRGNLHYLYNAVTVSYMTGMFLLYHGEWHFLVVYSLSALSLAERSLIVQIVSFPALYLCSEALHATV